VRRTRGKLLLLPEDFLAADRLAPFAKRPVLAEVACRSFRTGTQDVGGDLAAPLLCGAWRRLYDRAAFRSCQ
jgi:hypothetical protein